jgi:antirestriction protein ArdC
MPTVQTSQNQTKINEKIKALTEKLEQGARDVFTSDKYAAYLQMISKFHTYSYRNVLLILLQYPGATHVAGYNSWMKNFNRHVKRGETGIQILGYTPYKNTVDKPKLGPDGKPIMDAKGKPITEKVTITVPAYKPVYVYDVSQTEGEPLPEYVTKLQGNNVADYQMLLSSLMELSPYPVSFEDIAGGANGYCDHAEHKIVVQKDMSQEMTLKTTIHEIAHAREHGQSLSDDTQHPSRQTKEIEAESIAYIVCAHLGIDTSDYSFGYVTSWSSGRELKELGKAMEHIQKAATTFINKLDETVEKSRARETDTPQTGSPEPVTAAPRRYNSKGDRQWNGKTAEQFTDSDVKSFMAETSNVLDTICTKATARAAEINAARHDKTKQVERNRDL